MAGGRQPYPPRRDPRQVRRHRVQPRPASTRALTAKLALFAVAATLVIGGLLAVQLANGADPALGPKARAKAASQSGASSGLAGSSTGSANADPYGGYSGDSGGYDEGGYGDSGGYDEGGYTYGDGSSSGYSNPQPAAPSPPPVTSSVS